MVVIIRRTSLCLTGRKTGVASRNCLQLQNLSCRHDTGSGLVETLEGVGVGGTEAILYNFTGLWSRLTSFSFGFKVFDRFYTFADAFLVISKIF